MKLLHRIGYYLGGFSVGLIILAFFLRGKKTSCDYGPNARTTKNIANKEKQFSTESESVMGDYGMDTLTVSNLIRYGEVNFSKSNTEAKDCKTYFVENSFKDQDFEISIENCDSIAIIRNIIPKK